MNYRLRSGEPVSDRLHSHVKPSALPYLAEALGKIDSENRSLIEAEVEMGRIIGDCLCVRTEPNDEIVYAQRVDRGGRYTRFVKDRQPTPSTNLVVIAKKSGFHPNYFIITAWIGKLAQPEPGDQNERPESLPFWSEHALVWGTMEIIPETETPVCPW